MTKRFVIGWGGERGGGWGKKETISQLFMQMSLHEVLVLFMPFTVQKNMKLQWYTTNSRIVFWFLHLGIKVRERQTTVLFDPAKEVRITSRERGYMNNHTFTRCLKITRLFSMRRWIFFNWCFTTSSESFRSNWKEIKSLEIGNGLLLLFIADSTFT